MSRFAFCAFASLLLTVSASGQGAFGQEWVNTNVSISIGGFTVSSSGSASYECVNCTQYGWIASGKHAINNGTSGATVASRTFGGTATFSYSGNISGATAYSNCYDARVEATGRFGKSQYINSGTMCAPPPPEPVTPTEPTDRCEAPSGQGPECSPIIINMTDGAWKFSGTDSPVLFDINADGRADRITWTGQGEPLAFLALDRNSNGTIDNGAELFGNYTRLASGQRAPNGFEALAEFDGNRDGSVSVSDPIWNVLLLWTDANHDGVSQPDEISRIADSRVTALGTDYNESARTDPADNAFRYKGILDLRDYGRRPYYDVYFRSVH